MSSNLTFKGISFKGNYMDFEFENGSKFWVKSFSDGILTIEPIPGTKLDHIANGLIEAFKGSLNGLKKVEVLFNTCVICVIPETATYDKILKDYEELLRKNGMLK